MRSIRQRPAAICAGLYSSGSTWAFNIVAELLRHKWGNQVVSFYADVIDEKAVRKIEKSSGFVIKTHLPTPSLRALAFTGLPIVLTVRDPRDAIVSFMQRFGQEFAVALDHIERSANLLLHLQERTDPLLLKYEDGFTAGVQGITAIADHFGISITESGKRELLSRFAPNAVSSRIHNLMTEGVLRGKEPLLECEEGTHWHPFHIGDGRIGKYTEILSCKKRIREINYATRLFRAAHGYPESLADDAIATSPMSGQPSQISMRAWIDHFIAPDLVCGWARCSLDGHRVDIAAWHDSREIGNAVADLFRPDLLSLGDGFYGFQLKLAGPFTLPEVICAVEIRGNVRKHDLGKIVPTPELAALASIGAGAEIWIPDIE